MQSQVHINLCLMNSAICLKMAVSDKQKKMMKKPMAVMLTAAVVLYCIYVYFTPPVEGELHIACLTNKLFGIYCPGCGLTRQIYYLMHFQFYEAFFSNVLGIITLPMLLAAYVVYIRWAMFNKEVPELPLWIAISYASVMFVFGIIRNLPFESFTYLAPYIP